MRHVAVLARAPSSGGKSRLTEGLSPTRAHALRTVLLADTLQIVGSTGMPCTVFVTPADALAEVSRIAGGGVTVAPQEEGDLGGRMLAAFSALFSAGARHVVLIGSDLPSLPPSRLADAFAALAAGRDAVLGPADDGGYYLIGLTRPRPPLFEHIAWGGPDVLRQTLAAAAAAGVEPALVESWHDVDGADDLRRVIESSAVAAHTREWFRGATTGG